MINNQDAVKAIDNKREGAIIVPTMNANNVHFGLPTVTSNQEMDLPVSGAMGKLHRSLWGWHWLSRIRKCFAWMGTEAY